LDVAEVTSSARVWARAGGPCAVSVSIASIACAALAVAAGLAFVLAPATLAAASTHRSTTTTTNATSTTSTTSSPTPTTAPLSPAEKWLVKAFGAEVKLGSVHVDGSIEQNKTKTQLHLLVNGDGEGGGTFTQGGYPIQIKRVGTLLYFDASKKFWSTHATAAQAKRYGGKWIEVSALDSRFVSFVQFLDAADLVQGLFQGHHSPLELSHSSRLDGRKMIVIKDVETANGKTATGLMYVSAKGTPYVYRIVDDTPGETSTLNFSGYGKPVSITVPAEAVNLT
jgi:hypothetical protein